MNENKPATIKVSEWETIRAAGQLPMFEYDDNGIPNLCASCQRPEADNDLRESLLMQRLEW